MGLHIRCAACGWFPGKIISLLTSATDIIWQQQMQQQYVKNDMFMIISAYLDVLQNHIGSSQMKFLLGLLAFLAGQTKEEDKEQTEKCKKEQIDQPLVTAKLE